MNESNLLFSPQTIPSVFYSEKYQQDVTTSLAIARDFEKQPKSILRDIDKLIERSKKLRENLNGNKNVPVEDVNEVICETVENELTEDEKLLMSIEDMFFEGIYFDKKNEPRRMFYMNRDGFSLLVMGFTGDKALLWKLKYIQLFNRLEVFHYSTHQAEQNVQQPMVVDPYKITGDQRFFELVLMIFLFPKHY